MRGIGAFPSSSSQGSQLFVLPRLCVDKGILHLSKSVTDLEGQDFLPACCRSPVVSWGACFCMVDVQCLLNPLAAACPQRACFTSAYFQKVDAFESTLGEFAMPSLGSYPEPARKEVEGCYLRINRERNCISRMGTILILVARPRPLLKDPYPHIPWAHRGRAQLHPCRPVPPVPYAALRQSLCGLLCFL